MTKGTSNFQSALIIAASLEEISSFAEVTRVVAVQHDFFTHVSGIRR